MAPPPQSFDEEPAADDNIGKAQSLIQWANTQSTASNMFFAQAYLAEATATRDAAWASQQLEVAQKALKDLKKKGGSPETLAAAKEKLRLAQKDMDWASMGSAAAQWQYGESLRKIAHSGRDQSWAYAQLRAAKKGEGKKAGKAPEVSISVPDEVPSPENNEEKKD